MPFFAFLPIVLSKYFSPQNSAASDEMFDLQLNYSFIQRTYSETMRCWFILKPSHPRPEHMYAVRVCRPLLFVLQHWLKAFIYHCSQKSDRVHMTPSVAYFGESDERSRFWVAHRATPKALSDFVTFMHAILIHSWIRRPRFLQGAFWTVVPLILREPVVAQIFRSPVFARGLLSKSVVVIALPLPHPGTGSILWMNEWELLNLSLCALRHSATTCSRQQRWCCKDRTESAEKGTGYAYNDVRSCYFRLHPWRFYFLPRLCHQGTATVTASP